MAATRDCKSVLRLSDKRTLANARQFAKKYETELDEMIRSFSGEDWFGLWWDQNGLFESSDPSEVRENLEQFRKLAEDFSDVTMRVEEGDRDSYEKLLEFYDKLKEKEEEAERGLELNKSKTVVRMYRNFLQKIRVEMDRKLSKVECVAQRRIIEDTRHTIHETEKEANDAKKQCETLKKEKEDLVIRNKEAEEVIKEQKSLQLEHKRFKESLIKSNEEAAKRYEDSQQENQQLRKEKKSLQLEHERFIESLKKSNEAAAKAFQQENQQLRETMMKSNEEANRRCESLQQENQKLRETFEESSKKADERSEILIQENEKLREMLEESNRKADERMLRLLEIMRQRQN